MLCMKDFIEEVKGRPAIIMGAGPSLFRDMERITPYMPKLYLEHYEPGIKEKAPVLFGINQRAASWFRTDFNVFLDEETRHMFKALPGRMISPFEHCTDYLLPDNAWRGSFSAHTAAWLACVAGCASVVLVGFDLYQGEREYFDTTPEAGFISSGYSWSIAKQLADWQKALHECPNAHVIKAASGPLVEIFGQYDPKQPLTAAAV